MENFNQAHALPKLPEMKVFSTIRMGFAKIGVSEKLVKQPCSFDRNMCAPIILLTMGVSFIGVYVFFCANTFFEYTLAFLLGSAGTATVLMLLVLIFKAEELFKIFNQTHTIVNTSEWTKNPENK